MRMATRPARRPRGELDRVGRPVARQGRKLGAEIAAKMAEIVAMKTAPPPHTSRRLRETGAESTADGVEREHGETRVQRHL